MNLEGLRFRGQRPGPARQAGFRRPGCTHSPGAPGWCDSALLPTEAARQPRRLPRRPRRLMQSIHCRLPALGLPSVAQPPVHSSIDELLHGRQHSSPLTSLRRHPEARLLPHKAPFSCYSSSPPLPQRTAKAATGQALDRVPIHAVQGTAVWEPAQAFSTPLQKHLSHTLTAFSPQAVTDHAVPPGPRPGPLLQLARGRRRPRPALHPRPRLLQFLLCPHHPVARPTRVLMSCL